MSRRSYKNHSGFNQPRLVHERNRHLQLLFEHKQQKHPQPGSQAIHLHDPLFHQRVHLLLTLERRRNHVLTQNRQGIRCL